ncbi:hypothetical protein Ndes2437B_g02245 [Nannochloris sp. 'desiccata']
MNQNRSTSGGLLNPSPQSKMYYHDSHGRKRTAATALDDPTSLEPPSHRQPPAAETAAVPPAQHVPSSYDDQPRKVITPGATQAAIARLSALKAQGRGTPPPLKPGSSKAAVVQQQQRPKPKSKPAAAVPKQPSPPIAAAAAPSGTKVLAPGATQAALARLGSRGLPSNVAPTSLQQPGAAVPAATAHPSNDAGPRKVITPGATQAALARLASLKSSGGHPNLPPPPHPLFDNNGGSSGGGSGVGHDSGKNLLAPSSASIPFTATAADYAHGTVVWAKMQSYPWWPAQVQHPLQDQMRLRHSSTDIFIVFYGTADYSWLPISELKLFRANLPEYSKFAAPRNKSLQRAIDQAWVSVGQPRPDVMGKMGTGALKPQQATGHSGH